MSSRPWQTDELAVGNARRQRGGDPLAREHRPGDELADQIVRIEHYRAPVRRSRALGFIRRMLRGGRS